MHDVLVPLAVRVRPVDPRGPELDAWHAVHAEAGTADRPGFVVAPVQELRAAALAGLPERRPTELVRLVLATDDDDAALGALRVELPLADNTHLAYAEVHVHPARRRRGVGTALLGEAERQAREAGRTLLTTDLDEAPALVDRSPGRAFLQGAGFREALREVRRDLALPVPPARLDALEAGALPHAAGYEVLGWADRCPDALVDARAELGRVMSVDAPLGEMDWHEEAWDAARLRERERLAAEQGRSLVVAAARHTASGALVGFTEVVVRPALPQQVEQWETLVLRAHRGHRLGLLLKLAVLRRLARSHPGARQVVTTNAETNAPMIAVNEALGYRPDGLSSSWQRAVPDRAPSP
ncbi:MAG: GCN5-related N-acetyltransferase [Frankiales bacterium]|nr:GCN5-related N-acetyltransferase [Frankiales bacterium]